MYFRKKTSGGRVYLQIAESRRAGGQVRQRVIATLGRLDLVFMDTTSLYFEGAGGQTLGRHGYSKDHRPDLPQMILAVLIDGDGRPVCSEMWPGNTADVTTLIPVIDRLRKRFAIGRICVVADRGMISTETIAELEARNLLYLLGTRERSDKVVRDLVLADSAPCVPLTITKRGHEIDYEAKAVDVGGRHYILCRNHQEAKRDAAARAAILANLERQLARGDKALVGNTGFRRFLKSEGHGHFAIDRAKADRDARFDGVFVLRTNTALGHDGSWPEIRADLESLTETEIAHDRRRFLVRAAPRPAASLALRAAGVALPPTVQALAGD